jgi:hypothetical protein
MQDTEIRRLEMFTRVRDFGASNSVAFQSSVAAKDRFATINSIVNELSAHAMKKDASDNASKRGSTARAILRDELREDMMAISRTARVMKINEAQFEDKFRMPPRTTDQALLTAARNFAAETAPFSSDFTGYDLSADFLEEFNNTIKLFEKAIVDQNLGVENRVIASAAIDDTIERGMETVRELDAIVRNRFKNDSTILAAWARAKHTERAPRPAVPVETQLGGA